MIAHDLPRIGGLDGADRHAFSRMTVDELTAFTSGMNRAASAWLEIITRPSEAVHWMDRRRAQSAYATLMRRRALALEEIDRRFAGN